MPYKATIINIIVSQAITHANFHPHVNFLIMATRQFFSPIMYSYLCNQCLMLWSSCSVQSLVVPTGRRVLLVTKSATVLGSWTSLQPLKEFAQQVESSVGFVFLKTYHNIFWGCFGVFRTISDIVFKADILPTDDFFERQVSCVSTTHPFPWQLQHWSDIGYKFSDQRCSI